MISDELRTTLSEIRTDQTSRVALGGIQNPILSLCIENREEGIAIAVSSLSARSRIILIAVNALVVAGATVAYGLSQSVIALGIGVALVAAVVGGTAMNHVWRSLEGGRGPYLALDKSTGTLHVARHKIQVRATDLVGIVISHEAAQSGSIPISALERQLHMVVRAESGLMSIAVCRLRREQAETIPREAARHLGCPLFRVVWPKDGAQPSVEEMSLAA